MANNPISVLLPADLPTDWQTSQVVSADGTSAGYTEQYGYNYLMQQVNAAQQAAEEIGESFAGLAELDADGMVPPTQMPGYAITNGVSAMGQTCPGGPLKLDDIQGNTVLGGTPAYNAPVSMESVEGPLRLHTAGKNLIDFSIIPNNVITQYGVTCTISDGKFELTGTSDRPGGSYTYIFPYGGAGDATKFYLPPGEYWLSGMPADQPNRLISLYINVYPDQASSSAEFNVHANLVAGTGFTLNSGKWITVNVLIQNGVTTDGVVIRPQIEVGSAATENEGPTAKTIEIPLIGIDGRTLDPLRSAYGGGTYDVELPLYTDKIIRLDGVWYVEHNAEQVDLTDAVWVKATDYMSPRLSGKAVNPGVRTNNPLCTHFPPRARSQSNTAGAWVGTLFVVGNDVLPSGANTTEEEMQAFCAAQNEAGTPVRVCLPMAPPVYEELHQDVQVLLNTLSVPGGVCSAWFEGDILPSGADIGFPRGDYPSAGLAGAYRWLEELSNPLPPPTTADLYAWALSQQRGGVFATSGTVTTQNVPETGDLTGILSVTEQGSAVSMLVFGPTGKLYSAKRAAGVWRGWVQVYSDLTPPPLMGGAAASQAGTAGLVPAPAAGAQGKYLRGDGTWADILRPRPARFVIGTSAAGWTAVDCDYLCDGTADDMEINAAIDALPSGGGEILLLDGTYNISSRITIGKANVSLRGCGPATVIARKFNEASANGVISCSAANCTISSLAIDGNKGSYTNENNRGVYATTSAANFTIEDLSIQNSRDGIYIGGMTGGRITGCRIKDSGAYGVYVYNAEAIDISLNRIDTTGETAVLINGGKSIKVDGNTITGSTNYGVRLFNGATMCTISGNICLDNAGGISIEDAGMCSVSGNLCMRGSGTPEDYDALKVTIRATSASSNNIIAGNLVMGKDVEDSGTGNLVVNNKFE